MTTPRTVPVPHVAPQSVRPAVQSKPVVKLAQAVKQAAAPAPVVQAPAAPAAAPAPVPVQQWKFAKCFGPADVLRFKDGTTFQFRLVQCNGGVGYSTSSEVVTTDARLAANLRKAARNPATGVVEVKL